MKDLVVPCKGRIRLVALTLAGLAGHSGTEVLPVLQNLFLDLQYLGPVVRRAIELFIATRKLSGRSVRPSESSVVSISHPMTVGVFL